MSLLDDNFISIPLYYMMKEGKYGSKQILILDDKKASEILEDPAQKDNVQILNTKWKELSWKEQNDLLKSGEKTSAPGETPTFDWASMQMTRVKQILMWWDLKKNENDPEPLPVSDENINKMPANVMRALLDKYDNTINISDEELKKV